MCRLTFTFRSDNWMGSGHSIHRRDHSRGRFPKAFNTAKSSRLRSRLKIASPEIRLAANKPGGNARYMIAIFLELRRQNGLPSCMESIQGFTES